MKKATFSITKKIAIALACLLIANFSFSQKTVNTWTSIKESSIKENKNNRYVHPLKYKVMSLDISALKIALTDVKLQSNTTKNSDVIISIPNPKGEFSSYKVYKNTTMHSDLEANFPEIRTYNAININNKNEVIKMDITPHGFHAMILSPGEGTVFIDPYSKGDIDNYQIYYKKDYSTNRESACEFSGHAAEIKGIQSDKSFGTCELRTYRLALACTGEYAAAVGGGTVNGALAAQVTTMNRVNGIYERDIAVTMTIIANNNLLVYTNSGTDPYTNNSGFAMLGENQGNINTVIGSGNYDIGHVFSTGGGGVAGFGVVCSSSQKARGVTGSFNPQGDSFDIDFVAHEIGHQFRGSHSFNGSQGSCGGGNRSNSTSYEPGSGTTIMAYAGICGSQNVQNNSDALFHGISLEEIGNFIISSGNGCAAKTPLTNSPPVITSTSIDSNIIIPKNTPFALTTTATDADGDALTYTWEQFDRQISTQPPSALSPVGPNFRSYVPSSNSTHYFPRLTTLRSNGPYTWERLPNIARTMNFRTVVRDNSSGGGCNDHKDVSITVDGNSGPFLVTAPNNPGGIWRIGTITEIKWDVAGTDATPINCENVDVYLSVNAGTSYPILLASNVPNIGVTHITVPNNVTTVARVMVMCSNGTFFDISDNFHRIDLATDINDLTVNQSIQSYFANDKIELSLTNLTKGSYNLFIVNALGQKIMNQKINVNSNTEKLTVPFNKNGNGIYYISISNDKGVYNSKFFKN